MSEAVADESRPKKERSPNFPFIPLKKAIERADALHANHKKEAARLVAIAPSWNYGTKSSGLIQTVAALKQYGLVEDLGSGEDRKVQVSDLARRIIVDQRPGAREQALKEAARSPKLFAEYIDKWVPDRPSDAHCISELELDRGFSADAARTFLRIFDETIAYANLGDEESSALVTTSTVQEEDDGASGGAEIRRHSQVIDLSPAPVPAGPKPLSDRLRVETNGNRLSVAASLNTQDEVDTLVRILEANKLVLPKALPPPATGTGAVNMD